MNDVERLSSGHKHLDAVLGGGLPSNAINLIVGLPGSGKTMLAEQYLFHNATAARPGLYFTTASEPLEKLIRYGQRLSFFDVGAVGESVFYDDLGPVLQREGLQAASERIVTALKDHRPGFLIIDSFKALQTYAADPLEFRRFVIELTGRVTALAIDSFWIGEYAVDEIATAPEFAVADAIIALDARRQGDRTVRSLQVLKLRGSGFMSGAHSYRLSSDGLDVFPRLADTGSEVAYDLSRARISTGIDTLDEMVGGGLWPGSATLIAGPSGSGKSLTGLQFLREGARNGERVIFASLQENPSQIARVGRGYGWDLAGIDIFYRSPVDIYIDEWVYELLTLVEETGAKRILIDSLSDLRVASPDQTRYHEYVYSLGQRCSRLGITLFMTHEIHDLFGDAGVIDSQISHLSDNVIILKYLLTSDSVQRAMIVLKTRGTEHEQAIREYSITDSGITFGPREAGGPTSSGSRRSREKFDRTKRSPAA
jgi:circadian clock protein KaiC